MRLFDFASVLCLPLFLSCALPPATAASTSAPSQEAEDFEAIRFGDAQELAYDVEFFPGTEYDPDVPTPEEFLGQRHGSRLAHHHEVLTAFRVWAGSSDRISLTSFGKTHEGRELVYAVITSPDNHENIEEIRANHQKLADPRGQGRGQLDTIASNAPAVAWMGYSIHGDELSGTDASMAVAYHLIAGQGEEVQAMLEELVILIDPCLNPDGRERIIGMVEQSAGYTPNLDYVSMHRGRWPFGRGNHYLFDMNRDWMAGTQPETRARWSMVLDWNPQLFVDAHEMGGLDTFLFYPQAAPFNPELPSRTNHWQGVFAEGASAAFDAQGWSYYTREWADAWGPFYSDAWGSLTGAIGILYEQAGIFGSQIRRLEGDILTYREAVHHQAAASWANLQTLRTNRQAILKDYLVTSLENVSADTEGNELSLAVLPDGNAARWQDLRRILDGQRMEYFVLEEAASMASAKSARGTVSDTLELPAGTLILPAKQPAHRRVNAFFQFDPRIDLETLKEEREELERKNSSKMYDVTAWSLPHALDLDAWWGEFGGEAGDASLARPAVGLEPAQGDPSSTYAWAVDGRSDGAVAFAARILEAGLTVSISDRDFETRDGSWSRGSVMIRRGDQEEDFAAIEASIDRAARRAGVRPDRITSGRAPGEGPDLGGGHFDLLSRPRVALVANHPVRPDTYGHLWHHLDVNLGVPFSIIDAQYFGSTDLRRYNVIILPPGGLSGVVGDVQEDLESWVNGGGTLIACGASAAMLTDGRLGMSSVQLRRHALEDLDVYERAVERERSSLEIEIDESELWEGAPSEASESAEESGDSGEEEDKGEEEEEEDAPLSERDAWMRRFSPSGANLLAEVDTDHWLSCGADSRMPLGMSGSSVFLAKSPIQTVVRFTHAEDLRLGGLLWPEARERIADSAYLTRERMGAGQIILFADMPAFRGYHQATARFFSNAVIYGPGLGADQPAGW